ncbi:hypothetical protein Q4R71_08050, partial [Morganella morganii]
RFVYDTGRKRLRLPKLRRKLLNQPQTQRQIRAKPLLLPPLPAPKRRKPLRLLKLRRKLLNRQRKQRQIRAKPLSLPPLPAPKRRKPLRPLHNILKKPLINEAK